MENMTFKMLCDLIISNAKEDREKAIILYNSAYNKINKDSSNHAIIGTTIAKYLERSSKTNDQLLSLMKILNEYDTDDSITDEEKDMLLDKIKEDVDNE